MMKPDLQILKLRVKFAKIFTGASVYEDTKKIFIDKPIEEYKNAPKRGNLYLIIEDRVFYSKTLSNYYKVAPKEVTESLKKYILEGITVSENSIESIVINTKQGRYIIGDIMEVVAPDVDDFEYFKKQ